MELPDDRLTASFSPDSRFELTPELVGPSLTTNRGIVGLPEELRPEQNRGIRSATLGFHLTRDLLRRHLRGPDEDERLHLFGQVKRIVRQWLDGGYLVCIGGTHPGQLLYQEIAERVSERIAVAITAGTSGDRRVLAVTSPYNPEGSSAEVAFRTSKRLLHETTKSHVNFAVCDSSWEMKFCRLMEKEPRVEAYVKNSGLGFEVPYRVAGETHRYLPDFIVRVRNGEGDAVHLVVEIKGQPDEETKAKAETMRARWVPGVNNLGTCGRWGFVELSSLDTMAADFSAALDRLVGFEHPALQPGLASPGVPGYIPARRDLRP